MQSNDVLTYEDLHSVIQEVGQDLKQQLEDSKGIDPASEFVIAGSVLTLKMLALRLRQRFEKSKEAKRTFTTTMDKIRMQGLETDNPKSKE
jgi:malonyl CoA-acyl carrier protein transacylase